jgi:hypothetical protein
MPMTSRTRLIGIRGGAEIIQHGALREHGGDARRRRAARLRSGRAISRGGDMPRKTVRALLYLRLA